MPLGGYRGAKVVQTVQQHEYVGHVGLYLVECSLLRAV